MEHRFLLAKCIFMHFFPVQKTRLHVLPFGDCTLGAGVGCGLVYDRYPRNEALCLTSRILHSGSIIILLQIVEMWDIIFSSLSVIVFLCASTTWYKIHRAPSVPYNRTETICLRIVRVEDR